jgi:hypothetical protein
MHADPTAIAADDRGTEAFSSVPAAFTICTKHRFASSAFIGVSSADIGAPCLRVLK